MACETNIIVAREVFYLYSTQHYGFASAPISNGGYRFLFIISPIVLKYFGVKKYNSSRTVEVKKYKSCISENRQISLHVNVLLHIEMKMWNGRLFIAYIDPVLHAHNDVEFFSFCSLSFPLLIVIRVHSDNS